MSGDLSTRLTERLDGVAREILLPARVGVDAVHIPTWEHHLAVGGEALLKRIYTEGEIVFCDGRGERLSSRLAGKEATLKVLGTGIRGVALSDVEVVSAPSGRPTITLHGPAFECAGELGLDRIDISLCHEQEMALAVAAGLTGVAP
jgi:holo-[acyl-carrier protein] synthase